MSTDPNADPNADPTNVSGEVSIAGGILRAEIVPGDGLNKIGSVKYSGDFKQEPEGVIAGLEELLAGALIDEAPAKIEEFFKANPSAASDVPPGEFLTCLTLGFMKVRMKASKAPDPAAWKEKGEL